MSTMLKLTVAAAIVLGLASSSVFAQGKSQGARKSLGALGRAAAQARAAASTNRVPASATFDVDANLGVEKAAPGLQRASSAVKRMPEMRMPLDKTTVRMDNQQRILDHRLDRAQHLRTIAERNGNERLLETADRMEASAIENHTRQTNRWAGEPTPEGETPEAEVPSNESPESLPEGDEPVVEVETEAQLHGDVSLPRRASGPKRGFWFRSR